MSKGYVCDHCGSKVVEYTFSFNKGLAIVLGKLFDAGGPVKIETLRFTNSQYSNYPKLRYWGLAEMVCDEESKRKGGLWQITNKGKQFVMGFITIPRQAVMRQKRFQRFEGEEIRFFETSGGYKYKQDYADEAREQLGLF